MQVENRSLQLELLKMMKEFHRVCEENGLTYYMLGGTALGAVRHQGFIPWDDDMDVGMPRKDYDRLYELSKQILPSNLELRFYKNTEKSPFHFMKLINKNTTLVERVYKNYVEGIYIDVFPLDGMKKYGFFNKVRGELIYLLHATIMNHFYTKERRCFLKKTFEFFAKKLNHIFLHDLLERLMTMEKKENYPNYLCNFLGAWRDREFIPVGVFSNPVLYKFEDASFFGPKEADLYLTSLYGDYMRLPPEKDRICKHDYYYVNLNLPYKEYIKKGDK